MVLSKKHGVVAGALFCLSGLTGWLLWAYIQPMEVRSIPVDAQTQTVEKADLLDGTWNLPGATKTPDGLLIAPRNFAIVNQQATTSQPNPPLNLFGTYLQNIGDITITASLVPGTATASLWFYFDAPFIADEFRVEGRSLELRVADTQLIAIARTSAGQRSATFALPTGEQHLTITRQNSTLTFFTNNIQIGQMDEDGLFGDNLWFGASAQGAAWKLAALDAKSLSGQLTIANNAQFAVPNKDAQSLQALAGKKRPGFTIGAAMAAGPLATDGAYRATALGQFGAMTTENDLKWQFIHPEPGVYEFAQADAAVNLARQQGLAVQAHTLVFGEANPLWVQQLTPQQAEATMLEHITKVASHFKGRVFSWDVVNEPLADYPEFEAGQTMRNHVWYKAMGKAYITKAFQAARLADPQALLFMNEFGLEEDGERWDAFYALVKELKQNGVPIDGVGFQAHVYERGDKIDPTVLSAHMRQLAGLGVKSRISEMDVYIEDGPDVQAQQYSTVLKACLSEPSCISFTTWGVSDRYDYFKDDDGSTQQGEDFIFSADMQPTKAFGAMRALLL